jgi:hypothetical protein
MHWVTRRPHARVALADSLPLFRTDCCRELAAAYLELLRGAGDKVPGKGRLDVTRLPAVIPHLILCALTLPDRCIYRVVGEEVRGRFDRNPVGLNYYEFVPAERRGHARHAMNMVIEVPSGFRVEIEQTYSSGLGRLVEAVAFPLASAQPGVDGFAVLAECAIGEAERIAEPGVTLLGTNVMRRDLIDIGFGTDESFEDLVPAGFYRHPDLAAEGWPAAPDGGAGR